MCLRNLFIGISLGANVLAARFYCSGQRPGDVGNSTYFDHTCADQWNYDGSYRGGFLQSGRLEIMGTPDDVLDQAVLYMRIYFLGMRC